MGFIYPSIVTSGVIVLVDYINNYKIYIPRGNQKSLVTDAQLKKELNLSPQELFVHSLT